MSVLPRIFSWVVLMKSAVPPPPSATMFRRDRVTWAGYLALGLFTFFLNLQGNIIPFLRDQFGLGYGTVSLHPAALAAGLIASGFAGDRLVARLGRRLGLALGFAGLCGGGALLALAPTAIVSIAGCLLLGAPGGLVLVIVPAIIAQAHGANRSIALGEANGIAYLASLTATLTMALFIAIGLDWRCSLLFGIGLVGLMVVRHRKDVIAEGQPRGAAAARRLPIVYWTYWTVLFGVIALEQCTLLWAPEFLERVQGLSRPVAATAAAAFSAAMLIGRLGAAPLLRHFSATGLFLLSLALTLPGFLLYWSVRDPAWSVGGLFVLGLGVAQLYPLTLGFAIGVAGPDGGNAASSRASMASGVAIFSMPMALGTLADGVGLEHAHLILPALAVLSGISFMLARRLECRD